MTAAPNNYPTMYREVIQALKAKIEQAYGVLYVHTVRIEDEGAVYWIAEADGDNNFAPSFRVIAHEQGSSEIEALDRLAARLGVADEPQSSEAARDRHAGMVAA